MLGLFVPVYADDSFIDSNSSCDESTLGSASSASLVAQWTAHTTTITYNCGTSNNSVAGTWHTPSGWSGNTQTATYDEVLTHPTGSTACTLTGYTFSAWQCKNGNTVLTNAGLETGTDAGKWKTDASAVTCTAQWTANTVDLNWTAPGEGVTFTPPTTGDTAKTCTYDGMITLPSPPPTRVGYTFDGWKVATSGGNYSGGGSGSPTPH